MDYTPSPFSLAPVFPLCQSERHDANLFHHRACCPALYANALPQSLSDNPHCLSHHVCALYILFYLYMLPFKSAKHLSVCHRHELLIKPRWSAAALDSWMEAESSACGCSPLRQVLCLVSSATKKAASTGRIFDRGVVINVCRSPDKDWQKDRAKYNDEQGRYLNNREINETIRKIIDRKYPVSQGNCSLINTLPANSVQSSSFVHTRRISLTINHFSVGLTRRRSRSRIKCRFTRHHFIVSAGENAEKGLEESTSPHISSLPQQNHPLKCRKHHIFFCSSKAALTTTI